MMEYKYQEEYYYIFIAAILIIRYNGTNSSYLKMAKRRFVEEIINAIKRPDA